MECYTDSDKAKLLDTNVNFVVLLKEDNLINNTTDEMNDIIISDDIDIDEI